jgi:hypothetical protein
MINKVEILRRRNKPKEPCMAHWKNWDELTFRRQTENIGCTARYHEVRQNFPVCSTAEEMLKWRNMMDIIKKEQYFLPCQGMPRIDFEFTETTKTSLFNVTDLFTLTIGYPEQAKLITQSRAVDFNTLIGNIGGYIGLFLGYLNRCIYFIDRKNIHINSYLNYCKNFVINESILF